MELIERNHCVISNNKDFDLLYSFKNFPVLMGCVDHPSEMDIRTDMNWWICKSTGSLQLNPLIPLDVLYANSHGSGSTGKLWMQHHKEFAKFIYDYNVNNALEIGSGHGILSKNYLKIHPDDVKFIKALNKNYKLRKQILENKTDRLNILDL